MADFEIERPSVDVQPIQPTYNINTPSFTIEINGSTPGQRGEQGPPGQDGRDGVDGINGIDGQDGVGVESIEQTSTSHESGGTNIITATLTDGSQSFFEIMNGEAGSGGGMETLESPVDISSLEEGCYRLPLNCVVSDMSETLDGGGLLFVTTKQVNGEDWSAFWIIEDKNNVEFIEEGNNTSEIDTNDLKVWTGISNYYHGSSWRHTTLLELMEKLGASSIADDLTTSSPSKVLSAKQGKVLKDLLDALATVASTGDYDDLINKPTLFSGSYTDLTNKPTIPDELSDLTDDTTHRLVTDTEKTTWNNKSDFSGSYNDLTNKPTIPNKTSQLTNDSNFVNSTNISDNIKASGYTTKTDPNLGTIEIVNYAKRYGGSNYAYLDSKTVAHTVNSVTNTLDNVINGKQETLVSGTNIKTINNQSLLGSGNIDVSGGGSTPTDVRVNGTSITSNNVADIITETAYDSSTNKIATMSDIPDTSDFIDKDVNNLTNYSLTTTLQANKSITKGIEYIVGTQAAATNLWAGVSTDTGCSSGTLYTGKVIIYHLPQAGSSSAATLNLTLPDGTTTGAKNVYRLASTTTTTNFAAGCDILMVYDGTNWKVNAYVDTSGSNTIGYQLRTNYGVYYNGASTSIYRYQLLVETKNGLEPFTSTSNKTGTTKTQLDPHYIPGGDIRYYSSTTEITAGSEIGKTSIWQQYQFDLRYSFNITSTTLTSGKPVYMKMSRNNDGTLSAVYSSASGGHPLTQTLPTTEDNYIYMFLGEAYNGYQIELNVRHPLYEFKNGRLREYVDATGGTVTETDPVFTSSAAYGISSSDITTWNNKSDFSGNYNDLTNKPTIPTVPTNISSFVNDSGYITGISSGDVTTALGYTPYSSANPNGYTSNTGTITSVKMNGTTVSSSGEADLGTVLTSHQSIKTINSNSLLGSGNLTIGELKELTSPVSLKDLATGTYRVPANCILMAETGGQSVKTTTYGGILMIYQQTDAASFIYIDDEQTITPDYDQGVIASGDAIIGYGYIYDTGPGNNNEYDYNYWEKGLHDLPDGVVNVLTSTSTTAALSAYQGKVLKDAIDGLSIPTKTSDLTNDSGFITSSYHDSTKQDLISSSNKLPYSYISGTPTIPTVNDSTITIQKNGTTVDSFTTNASSNKSINITVPTNNNELTNGAGYITSSSLPTKVSDLTNDAGYTTFSGDYDDLTNKPTIPTNRNIVDLIYPVGSIYMSCSPTLPSILFGGSWMRIEDKFLLSAGSTYSAGTTGGSATHTLTTDELPAHTHGSKTLTGSITMRATDSVTSANSNLLQGTSGILSRDTNSGVNGYRLANTNYRTAVSDQYNEINVDATHEHDSVGGGQSFSTLPPYMVVYMWQRTA